MAKRFVKYNPSFLSDKEIMDSFVVRHADLDLIINIIGENMTVSNQHVLIIGPRGSGKTTLVRRVTAEIKQQKELHDRWYPLTFSEESYKAVTAADFWLEALFHLAGQTGDKKWLQTHDELRLETDDKRLGERALGQLLDFADTQKKRILLNVENLNMLFSDLTSKDEAWSIRHTLMNEPRLMLLATATSRFDDIDSPSHAMFEMFKIHELKPLDDDECNCIWKLVTGKKLIGEQIRPVRILTGGNPRLLAIIAKFGAHRSFRQFLDDLVDLIDDHTDYFKSHLDNMPAIERKVYLALAELWKLSTAREIALSARLDVNKTSSLLSRLAGRGAVVIEEGGKRTKWYRLAEGIYNIYYLMRRRGSPADRVKAVVSFMVAMYGPESATNMIAEEACSLPPERCTDHYAAYEEVIKNIPDPQLLDKIIASTPRTFLESPYINNSLKRLTVANKMPIEREKLNGEEETALKEAMEMVNHGVDLGMEGNNEEALSLFDTVINRFKNTNKSSLMIGTAGAMHNKGISLRLLNRFEDAVLVYDELIALYKARKEVEIAEQVVLAMVNKGLALGSLNRLEEAVLVYDEVIALYKDRQEVQIAEQVASAMFLKGLTLFPLKRSEEAVSVYYELIELYKDRQEVQFAEKVASAMFYKGLNLSSLNRSEEALLVYDELITLYKDRNEVQFTEKVATAMLNKGLHLVNIDRYDEAENTFNQAIEIKPDLWAAYEHLIALQLKRPDGYEHAMQTAEAIISKSPTNAKLLNAVAWAFYKNRDFSLFQKAETLAQQAVAISPENSCMQHTLACISAALGKGREALELTAKYVKDAAIVEKTIEDAIELFVQLAAGGYAKEALEILVNSPAEKHLEPLVVGLKLYSGEEVKTAVEIQEVANDLVKRIEQRKQKQTSK